MDNKRLWVSKDGMAWYCHPKSYVFCDNCIDIFYDHNGPYMCICDKGLSEEDGAKGKCKQFTEENPNIITEEEYRKTREETEMLFNELKEKGVLDKIYKAMLDYMFYGFAEIKDIKIGDKR